MNESPFPTYGSHEHLEWLAKRLQRNRKFRQQCDDWALVPMPEKRAEAARVIGQMRKRAA